MHRHQRRERAHLPQGVSQLVRYPDVRRIEPVHRRVRRHGAIEGPASGLQRQRPADIAHRVKFMIRDRGSNYADEILGTHNRYMSRVMPGSRARYPER